MIGSNEYIGKKVYTQRGIIDVKEVVPGDTVYEYGTNEKLRVISTVDSECKDLLQIVYTDGRTSICTDEENVLNGDEIIPIFELSKTKMFQEIDVSPVDFNYGRITEPLFPDPYVAGALLIYGRYDTEYINLPLDRSAADQLFSNKYSLDFADKLEDNTTFYAWNSSDPANPITWNEFFPKYDCYVKSRKVTSPLIPKEYTDAPIRDRMKFIMGVFDIGYNKEMFPNSVGIAHIKEERLMEVQRLLWSLGVLSKITYDPLLPLARGREYRLDILGNKERYPAFFYDINAINQQILNNKFVNPINPFKFMIDRITPLKENGAEIKNGFTTNLLLDKHKAIYVSENFLPRVSL